MLSLNAVSAGYGASTVLNEVDLWLEPGRVLALMGRNGMGKTTMLKAIMGLLPLQSGQITFAGDIVSDGTTHEIARKGLGYVPQGREIFDDFTVMENLRLGLLGHPDLPPAIPPQIFEWFPVLAERAGQRAGSFSGGQQQMLAIARALVSGPKMILLDEPTEGIQPSLVHEIGLQLRRIVDETGLGILLVEQNVDIVRTIADEVIFLDNGQTADRSPISAILDDDALLARHLTL